MDGTRARALLGVSAHATPDELRQAFRRRALSTHPDRGGDACNFDETVAAFRSLSAATAIIPESEPVVHVPFDRYDTTRPNTRRPRRPSFAEVLQRVTATAIAA